MSQAYHVRHESSSSPGYPAPYPPPQAPGPPPPPPPPPPVLAGYPRPDHGVARGYQGYFSGGGGYPAPSATPPPLRPYHQHHDRYGLRCSSLLRGCLAALCCCCILDECCI